MKNQKCKLNDSKYVTWCSQVKHIFSILSTFQCIFIIKKKKFLHFIILHVGCTTIILLVAPHGFDFDGDFFLSKYE